MDTRRFFTGRAIGLIVLLIIAGIAAGFYFLNDYIYEEKQGDEQATKTEPYRGTLTGVYVCLPHRDMSGSQTDECANGMRTDAGEYYAINFWLMSQTPPEFTFGDRLTATGLITPVESLATNEWDDYQIVGVFSVTDSVVVE